MSKFNEKIKDSAFSAKIVSFIDKVLVVDISKLFFFIIFSCTINYIWELSLGVQYVWRTSIDFMWLVVFGINGCLVFILERNRLINYSVRSFTFISIFISIILIASSFTLSVSYVLLLVSYILFFASIFILSLYCEIRNSIKNSKKYDLANKFGAFLLIGLSFLFYWISGLSDPLLSSVILCSFPFYFISFFINKIEGILLQYRVTFFVYLFFIGSTIYPYLFVVSLVLFFISKFYFFIKYDTKYPTFLNNYDISR